MYKYYSTLRPIGPGCYPKTEPVHKIVNFDKRELIPSIDRQAWGYIEYERPLTPKDAAGYDLIPEPPSEDKEKICRLLCKVLQLTRGGSDLLALEYDAKYEIVAAHFEDGCRTINVAGDSGTTMIRDIVNRIGI